MNHIGSLFKKKKDILSIYFTAGFPYKSSTQKILRELIGSGVEMVEIGIPFSDPLADGPTIQHSSEIALKNGMNLKLLLEQIRHLSFSIRHSNVPLILMGYLNPVLQYGIDNFCRDASRAGISGVILPDLPPDEYREKYQKLFEKFGLANIFLVTPQTSVQKIRKIDRLSNGFIYLVSSSSTTGSRKGLGKEQEKYFKRVKAMKLRNPLMIGFGIHDRKGFKKACRYAQGGIIGSAFIRHLEESKSVRTFVRKFKP